MSVEKAIERIRAWRTIHNMSKSSLARASGVSRRTLVDIDHPEWNPTADTLKRLEKMIPPRWRIPRAYPAPAQAQRQAAE